MDDWRWRTILEAIGIVAAWAIVLWLVLRGSPPPGD